MSIIKFDHRGWVIAGAAALIAPLLGFGLTSASAQSTVEPLARDCSKTSLPIHDGFQKAPACVTTAFGEVSDQAKNPTLLIVDFPDRVRSGKSFTLKVATRNLVRDRFLAAAAGGYYLESSLLNDAGLQRGHFHVACRVLERTNRAPADPEAVPEFFRAVEDGQGGTGSDAVKVEVPGKAANGAPTFKRGQEVQCAAWAGDGSHRIPMMERANQTPAFDAVRLMVR